MHLNLDSQEKLNHESKLQSVLIMRGTLKNDANAQSNND